MSDARRSVLIIGGGPAGLAAAVAARAAGATVTLLDAADDIGGQYWRHLPPERPSGAERILHHGWATFTALRDRLRADPGCELVTSAQVWSLETGDPAPTVHVDRRARRTASAARAGPSRPTRSCSRPAPTTARSPSPAGICRASSPPEPRRRSPRASASRWASASSWPAPGRSCCRSRRRSPRPARRCSGVFEASRMRAARDRLAREAVAAGPGVEEGRRAGRLRAQPRRQPHPVSPRMGGRRGARRRPRRGGDGRPPRRATGGPIPGTERRIEADAVCVSHGFTPRLELPIAAGCALGPDRFVVVDDRQRSSVPGVYAAGELTGIGGVDAALAEGAIAGHCAAGGDVRAARDGRAPPRPSHLRRLRGAHRARARHPAGLDGVARRRDPGLPLRGGQLRAAARDGGRDRIARDSGRTS